MKRIMLFTIIIVIGFAGCSKSGTRINDATAKSDSSSAVTSNSSEETTNITTQSTSSESKTSSIEDETFSPDFEGINEIMKLKKGQVIEKLGSEFETVNTGAEGQDEGIYYKKYGMTIVFDEFLASGMIDYILCDKKVDVKGAKLGMTFSKIKKCLGDGEISEEEPTEPNQPAFILTYKMDNFIVWFGASDKNGATTDLQIRRDYLDDSQNTQ